MAPIQNSSAIFNSVPKSYPVHNETIIHSTGTIDLDNVPLEGGILAKTLYLSIDPYQRGQMRAQEENSANANTAFEIGKPIIGFAIASVLRSEKEGARPGDIIYTYHYRQTAYYGLEVIGRPAKSETIYVSSGASSVGSLVVQLAKIKGLKVIASAGSPDKVAFLQSIGADVAFNYKTENIPSVLSENGPIDIYWDNVGGETLEAALYAMNTCGRVIACGAISGYNSKENYGVKNTSAILYKRLRVEGLFVFAAEEVYEGEVGNPVKFLGALSPLVKSGQVKFSEQIFDGIESVGEATVAVQTGKSTGKVVIKVSSDYE